MNKLYQIILSILFSIIIAMMGYWLKSSLTKFEQMVLGLHQVDNSVKVLQTQIEKGVEVDITELKSDIKALYQRVDANESNLSLIKGKIAL